MQRMNLYRVVPSQTPTTLFVEPISENTLLPYVTNVHRDLRFRPNSRRARHTVHPLPNLNTVFWKLIQFIEIVHLAHRPVTKHGRTRGGHETTQAHSSTTRHMCKLLARLHSRPTTVYYQLSAIKANCWPQNNLLVNSNWILPGSHTSHACRSKISQFSSALWSNHGTCPNIECHYAALTSSYNKSAG